MRTQWTTKGNWDAGSYCSCDRGHHRYLRNFGEGGLNPPNPPLSVCHWQPPPYITLPMIYWTFHARSKSYYNVIRH